VEDDVMRQIAENNDAAHQEDGKKPGVMKMDIGRSHSVALPT
jgi:hypothetical protein